MKDIYILAIESSCDETSMSIIKNGREEIATVVLSQIDIHKNYGGVVPEIASRNHIENITIVLDEILNKSNMTLDEIDAIGVTYGPGLIGSLLIGVQAAKTIALVTGKPLIPVHHIAGHIYANNLEKRLQFPLIALNPLFRIVNLVPVCVASGILYFTFSPFTIGISSSAPSVA